MNVLFACAGTGGHINPAIAIAKIILKNNKDTNILFVGTENGLENKLVKNAGFEIKHIRTGKIIREFTLKNFSQMYKAYKGISDAEKIMKEFKPDFVVGTGGYICVPVMFAAKNNKIPYFLHESNAFPGVSVKLLANKAESVMVGFEAAKDRLKRKDNVYYTGTPAKFDSKSFDKLDKLKCKKELNLDNIDKKIIFITCGSQGAKYINEVVIDMVCKLKPKDYFVILVTGDKNYDDIKKKVDGYKVEDIEKYLKLEKFVFDMDKMYKAADVCVTRAGAMTITELCITAKPSILIPLPTAAENHQFYNAKVLEEVNAAKILEQKNLNINSLNSTILEIIKDENIEKMSINARSKMIENVDEKIYNVLEKVVKNK